MLAGRLQEGYRLCLWSRVASRVLLPLVELDADDDTALYDALRGVAWWEHFDATQTFAIGSSQAPKSSLPVALLGAASKGRDRRQLSRPCGHAPEHRQARPGDSVSLAHRRGASRACPRFFRGRAPPTWLPEGGRKGAAQGEPGGGDSVSRGLASGGSPGPHADGSDLRFGHLPDRSGIDGDQLCARAPAGSVWVRELAASRCGGVRG